ncbi:HD-GYP domain-containing protein [Pseudothermotoga thermarum]|uniref:Metal dependent phosphohydrolase n=1 Tax=Pseudothermotoga thermarum DSM 5069 TaxID=688269 RepID=F7YWM2_9THEM|nr:HD-GYP domain-containing protein [Pseudothermotoga thermarum]AEH52006.1 metal dependent phosphohydrolase [Pseudothermotoga thermarum DSM 5069]
MRAQIFGKINSEISNFFQKMSATEEKDSPQLFVCDQILDVQAPQLVIVENQAKFYDAQKRLVASFENIQETYEAAWIFAKAYLEKAFLKSGLVSSHWARKITSGILQALVVLLEVEDKEGFSHSQRVAKLAKKMGERLNLSEKDLALLVEGAMLHDVGKIGIEQLMMFSPARIREIESTSRDHTIVGSIYLASIELLWDLVPIVRSHHERWDGTGYPDGLKGEEIPFFARIIAICDYYDELTNFVSSEWGPDPKTKEEALQMIQKQSGKMFDPKLVEVFVEMMSSENVK